MLKLLACEVDLDRGRVRRGEAELPLTTREAELLRFLAVNRDRVVTREEMLREVWGYSDAVLSRASDNVVRRLREKIEADPAAPSHLLTVFGAGYRFVLTGDAEIVAPAPHRAVAIGHAVVDLTARRIRVGDRDTPLSEAEGQVLEALLAASGEPVDRARLERLVWGRATRSDRRLDALIHGLRAKLERDPTAPVHLHTARNRGYRLEVGGATVVSPERRSGGRLPTERDPFVGRSRERQRIGEALQEGARLLTLCGTGGVGKTRLALRHAWSDLGAWPGGVWFCDLAEARSADEIVLAVASALDLALGPSPIDQLGHALAARGRCLVVLDNFEQLVAFAEPVVGRWRALAPECCFLVTSREVLGLPGEVALPVGPLAPDEAVALFELRARWGDRTYEVTADERPTLDALVALLDHLPLAIELAVARVRSMRPDEILARLALRFQLLVGSPVGRPARQATLRATLDWSWDLLDQTDRLALAKLSMFEGPFTLDLAEELIGDDDGWPADAVQSLVERSLVQRGDEDGRSLSLLWSVQDYARERLRGFDPSGVTEVRHGRLFAEGAHEGPLPEVIAACRRAVARGDAEVAVATGVLAGRTLARTGPYAIGEELLCAVLSLPLPAGEKARIELQLGTIHTEQGRLAEARVVLARALPDADDPQLAAAIRNELGRTLQQMGRHAEAMALHRAALALYDEHGATDDVATTLRFLGGLSRELGDLAGSADLLHRAVAAHRASGDTLGLARALCMLGITLEEQGRPDEGWRAHTEARALAHRTGWAAGEANALLSLGAIAHHAGREGEGVAAFEEAAAIARRLGNRTLLGAALANLGVAAGFDERARPWLIEALAVAREIGSARQLVTALLQLAVFYVERGGPAVDLYREALAHAHQHGLRVLEGLALLGLAWVLAEQGAFDDAAELLARGRTLLADQGVHTPHVDHAAAWLQACQGRWDEARELYRAAVEGLRARPSVREAARVLREWEQVERAAGHIDRAEALRVEAEATDARRTS